MEPGRGVRWILKYKHSGDSRAEFSYQIIPFTKLPHSGRVKEATIPKQFGKYGPERVIYDIIPCPENFSAVFF